MLQSDVGRPKGKCGVHFHFVGALLPPQRASVADFSLIARPGRFYFFNLETSKSEWSLQPWQLGLDGLGEGKEDVTPAGGKSHASTGNLAAMDVTYGVETSAAAAVDSQQSTAASSWGLGNLLGSKKGGSMKHSSSANDLSSMGEMGTSATGGGGYSGTMGSMLLGSKTGRQDLRTSNNRPASGGSLQHSASTGSLGEEGGWGAGLGHLEGGRAPVRVLDGLGQGGYSCVVACEHTATGQPFALKVISKSKVSRKRDRARLRLELSVMMELPPSPFLQRCHMAFESPSQLFFVLDFVSGGDLFFHLVLPPVQPLVLCLRPGARRTFRALVAATSNEHWIHPCSLQIFDVYSPSSTPPLVCA